MKMAQSKEGEDVQHVMAPPPSIFYSKYTTQEVRAGTAPPPPPPLPGQYTAFGITHNLDDPKSILSPLREHGVTQLYQDAADNIKELKKLNSSFLVNFLDLLDTLIQCPSSPLRIKKLEDLELLFCNFHHLINKFRPHQALETLIQMVKIQRDQKHHLIEQINSKMEAARSGLHTTVNSLPSSLVLNNILSVTEESMAEDNTVCVDEEFGKITSDIEILVGNALANS